MRAHLKLFSKMPGYLYVYNKPIAFCSQKLLEAWIDGLGDDYKLLGTLDDFWRS